MTIFRESEMRRVAVWCHHTSEDDCSRRLRPSLTTPHPLPIRDRPPRRARLVLVHRGRLRSFRVLRHRRPRPLRVDDELPTDARSVGLRSDEVDEPLSSSPWGDPRSPPPLCRSRPSRAPWLNRDTAIDPDATVSRRVGDPRASPGVASLAVRACVSERTRRRERFPSRALDSPLRCQRSGKPVENPIFRISDFQKRFLEVHSC